MGTDIRQPASEFLKQWAMLMGSAPAIVTGGTATVGSMAVSGGIGGTSNAMVQLALNGEQEMSKTDVLIAIATAAATQGRSIHSTMSINSSGAALGASIKGDAAGEAAISAALGAAAGDRFGTAIGHAAKGIATPSISNAFGSVAGSLFSEGTTATIQKKGSDKNGRAQRKEIAVRACSYSKSPIERSNST